ncbi:hypothetical protein BHYA_0064g00210 [Botrytis hyacinthi]|uniref:Uncharacterized protein n=1 Tax=Botrytis hyacinthi TaxID=278943 RepID=A0A4Z1GQA0_9HELO|nr:hypothetical protein BHYA_0064g00210 [Botrytis hyacinthi]
MAVLLCSRFSEMRSDSLDTGWFDRPENRFVSLNLSWLGWAGLLGKLGLTLMQVAAGLYKFQLPTSSNL